MKESGDFVANSNSAIVILPDNSIPNNAQRIPSSEIAIGKSGESKTANAALRFDQTPNEVGNIFARPQKFGPRTASFEAPVGPNFEISKESLTELPGRYRRLVENAMSTSDHTQVRAAVTEIQSSWPSRRYAAIVALVQKCVLAKDVSTRILAIETLAQNDPKKSLEYIVSGIDDPSIDVREATHKILEELSDSKSIPLLVERYDSVHRKRVALTLSRLGPEVEPHVISFASHTSVDMQMTTCNLLAEVGTQKSIKALQSVVANSKQARVRLQASNAIDRINSRSNSSTGIKFGS